MSNHGTKRESWRRWLIWGASFLLILLVVWAARKTLSNALAEFDRLRNEGGNIVVSPAYCLSAGLVYFCGFFPAAWFWYRVLNWLGQDVSFLRALRAYSIGQLGKYVPGKAWVVILRASFVQGEGVQPAMAAAGVFLETLTMMSVGAVLAVLYLVINVGNNPQLFWVAVGLFILVTLPTLPPIFRPILRFIARKGQRQDVLIAVERLGLSQLAQGWLAMSSLWFMYGLSLGLTLKALGVHAVMQVSMLPNMVAAVSLATVAGFLILILPGGLGAREFVLIAVLAPALSGRISDSSHISVELIAVLAAGLLRVIWLITEAVVAGVSWLTIVVPPLLRIVPVTHRGQKNIARSVNDPIEGDK
ncbi:MAG: lysylphosphatidylglycerol synthase transmembrane domain-containing protein [Thermogutta sp.]